MLKLASQKRPHDWIQQEPAACSSLRLPYIQPPLKKNRNCNSANPINFHTIPSPFIPTSPSPILEHLENYASNKKKRTSDSNEPLFTMAEVRSIVEKAVEAEQQRIKQEYDKILFDNLQEQYNTFSKFNEDCITRQFQNNDFSYMS
eukprot:TRINITY_DN12590_c0_g1_i1.p1 TRINITY_DN12590_c0_g1~~TRINITY_DN12590_c0_g1_i1.p1  ORF type:complete len:146 (+),score=28.42 TRINITY_DN12590_c0_g1_i1:64-501(+)